MDDLTGQPERLILSTETALLDLAAIDNATAAMWGAAQAERYLSFLNDVLSTLANHLSQGVVIEQYPQYRSYTARFSAPNSNTVRKTMLNLHGTELRLSYRILRSGGPAMEFLCHFTPLWVEGYRKFTVSPKWSNPD